LASASATAANNLTFTAKKKNKTKKRKKDHTATRPVVGRVVSLALLPLVVLRPLLNSGVGVFLLGTRLKEKED
jgi:hypothetical protein